MKKQGFAIKGSFSHLLKERGSASPLINRGQDDPSLFSVLFSRSNTPRAHNNSFTSVLTSQTQQQTLSSKNRRQVQADSSFLWKSKQILKECFSNKENSQPNLSVCHNRCSRPAQFSVSIDDEEIGLCRKCADNLAGQGFDVQPLQRTPATKMIQTMR